MKLLEWLKDIHHFKFIKEIFHSLGFNNLGDMAASVLLVKNAYLAFVVASVSFFTSLIFYIEGYVYAPIFSLIIFCVAIIAESSTGTLVNVVAKKERFNFDKSLRFLSKLVGQSFLLAFAHNLGKATELYGWLPLFVWMTLTGINFAKTARNLTKLKSIDGSFMEILEKRLGSDYKKKKEDKDEPEKD